MIVCALLRINRGIWLLTAQEHTHSHADLFPLTFNSLYLLLLPQFIYTFWHFYPDTVFLELLTCPLFVSPSIFPSASVSHTHTLSLTFQIFWTFKLL